MSFVEGVPLSKLLKDPLVEGRPVLNPRISERALWRAFREMAKLPFELSKQEFPRIGALRDDGEDFIVAKRPFTFNMSELATSANLSPQDFPTRNFESAADYFEALAVHTASLPLSEPAQRRSHGRN